MATNDPTPLFLSDHAEEPQQPGIDAWDDAWDEARDEARDGAVIASRTLKASILVVAAAAAIGFAILSVGNPLVFFANATAFLVATSAPQDGTDQPTPTMQATAIAPDLPPDHPLEPGTRPTARMSSPSERIAASESVINEIALTIITFSYDAERGALKPLATVSTVPEGVTAGDWSTAEIEVRPDGRFLYGTNRGHDSIAAYRIGDDGRLTLIGIEASLGKGPQNLAITPDGGLLLCATCERVLVPGAEVLAWDDSRAPHGV